MEVLTHLPPLGMSCSMRRKTGPLASAIATFRPLKPYFVESRKPLLVGLCCLLLVDLLQLLIPQIIKRAVNALTEETARFQDLLLHAGAIVGVALLIALLRYAWRLLIFGHSRMVEQRLRNRLYAHLQTLSQGFFHRMRTGDLMARAVSDINAVRMASGMGLVALVDGLLLGLAAVGFMVAIDWRLTLLTLIPAPFVVFLARTLTRRMSKGFDGIQKTFSNLTERVREAFAGVRVLKAFSAEGWHVERIRQEGETYVRQNMEVTRTLALFFPSMAAFTNLGLVVLMAFGGRLTILGEISTGDFVAFTSYLNLLTWPMMAMGWVTNLMQRGAASMRRILQVLEERPEIADPPDPLLPPDTEGRISIRGLGFTYPGKAEPALGEISLEIAPGMSVAFVGRVGSGKSTLVQILPRLLEAPPDTVFLDGVDIRRMSLDSLRGRIGFVTQETFLFSDTLRNNLLLGMEGLPDEALLSALEAADIRDEILGLEKGLDSRLGERGLTLSGGQRQRVALARALLRDPPVLVLDDAISMVDTRTEERILNHILYLRKGRTTLFVSHRVSTLGRVDRIFVLDRGRILEEGGHQGLLEREGVYAALYAESRLSRELEEEVS